MVLAPLASKRTETLNGPKNVFLTVFQHRLAGRHVRAADEDGRRGEVGRAPREQGPVNEVANVLRRHATVAEQVLDTGVDGHDGVEDAGLWIGVELDQDLRFHGSDSSSRRTGA